MREDTFCFFGLLCGRQRLNEVVPLLPAERQAAVRELIGKLGEIPAADVRARWKQARDTEADELCKRAAEETGIRQEFLPPFLRDWIFERARHA